MSVSSTGLVQPPAGKYKKMSSSETTQPTGSARRESEEQPEAFSLSDTFLGRPEDSEDVEMGDIAEEDRITWEDDETSPVAPLPASIDPAEPLSSAPAMEAALEEISGSDSTTRTRAVGDDGPAATLRAMLEAKK